MKIALADVPSVLVAYLEKHILPKAQSKSEKSAVAVAMFIATKKGIELVNNPAMIQKARMLGILDEAGYVDMDYFKEMALFTLEKTDGKMDMSVHIPFVNLDLGYVFDAEDVETVYKIAQTVSQ